MKTKLYLALLLAACLFSACTMKIQEVRNGNYVIKYNTIVFDEPQRQ